MDTIAKRIEQLRQLMTTHDLDFYVVPARDPHNNEYVPACWQRRQWISGFDGSAGDVVVGKQHALLWTDSRYFLQAEQQLDPAIFTLMKQQPGTPSLIQWLADQGEHLNIGIDPNVINLKQAELWQMTLAANHSELTSLPNNLIDQLRDDQPPLPLQKISQQAETLSGLSTQQKVSQLRQQLADHKADSHVLVSLDTIAWLFNIRGDDIDYNPLAISFAIIQANSATLFIDNNKISDQLKKNLQQQGITIANYTDFYSQLKTLNNKVWLDPIDTPLSVKQALSEANIHLAASPIKAMKAIKTPEEQQGMADAHHQDALALVEFFYWLEQHWSQGLNECSAASQLEQLRRQQPDCRGLSFATISGFADNGAIVHYQPHPQTAKTIDDSNLYLLDSGGQYRAGTTDVTRTLHLGQAAAEQKKHYTLVLKGHLALRHAIFPDGTCGYQLDSLARQFLWQAGLDFGHGTGHGVGCYLCVHEGPHSISPYANATALKPGMMVSNEPGVYLEGQYGIRIENVCQVIEHSPSFYTFKDLTLVPYALNLIDEILLSPQEINWINEYHQLIFQQLSPHLSKPAVTWLQEATQALKLVAPALTPR